MHQNELKAGALFAGIGGFCLGFAQAGIKTVWAIENNPASVQTYQHNIDSDHIQIVLSKKTKETIDNVRASNFKNKVILMNSIYFSAVMQALLKIQHPDKAYEDKKWVKVFEKNAHNKNCNLENDDAYVIAQTLLQYPLKRMKEYVFKEKDSE